jgi:hypothetical protein
LLDDNNNTEVKKHVETILTSCASILATQHSSYTPNLQFLDGEAYHISSLIKHDNEIARLITSRDWSNTPLGPLSSWPVSLLTIVNIVVGSDLPMMIMWGRDLIEIYNKVC